jgi:hypothetical protein
MSDIKIVDIELDDSEMTSTVYTVELNGKTYKVDRWSTHNASGTEFYGEGYEPLIYDAVPDELVEWDPDEDTKSSEFWQRYHAEVVPLMERIRREVFG